MPLLGIEIGAVPIGAGPNAGGVLTYRFHVALLKLCVGLDPIVSSLRRCPVSAALKTSSV
jgi:hypothetical protein